MRVSVRRADALVFALSFAAVAWFHQGGGWNQNARFAMTRAIVEDGSLSIDRHLVYFKEEDGDRGDQVLQRLPVERGNYERGASRYALAWTSPRGELVAVDPASAGDRRLVALDAVAASGDVAYAAGRFHPNKAPGTSFAAVPAYALVRAVAALFALPVDDWGVVTTCAWLTSALSVGLATTLAAVLVLRVARRFASEGAARAAAVTFALGTMALPLGTLLMEHNLIAAAFVAALWLVERAAARPGRADLLLHAAGAAAGFAAIANYTMALLVPVFALPLLARRRAVADLAWYGSGVLWPLGAILAYNIACFGTPFTTNYAWQSPMFVTESRALGVFALPRLDVAALLLFSPFRGLFFTSPVLLMAAPALVALWRRRDARAFVATVAGVFAFLLLVNASFNGWDGGWTAVPRYLAPATALLAIPLAVAFDRWRAATAALAALSVAAQLTLTAVDPQVPVGDVGTAGVPVSQVFFTNPMTLYVLPLLVDGRAMPLLEESVDNAVAAERKRALARGESAELADARAANRRRDLETAVGRGDPSPFPLAAIDGPVSANVIGMAEGAWFQHSTPRGAHARGNSFNVGEWLLPGSVASLAPLLLLLGALAWRLLGDGAAWMPRPREETR